jgi:hypothetical protein
MIYAYGKFIDNLRTVEILLPVDGMERLGTELATVDGTTYVYLPDTATLPVQPPEITVESVTLTPELLDAIKAASPHVRLINARVVEQIRLKYSLDDELGMLRRAPSDESSAYDTYVEECRAWGQTEKAKIGLGTI